ncbi:Asp-tRNA(Asn)/Glu-tRNA(Gln) amidotransferase subunit GatA [Elusimicrobiota bacterium]
MLNLSAIELSNKTRKGEIDPIKVLDTYFAQIEKHDKNINAFLCVSKESAYDTAKKLKEKIASGKQTGTLCGVPIAVKDNIMTSGSQTTCASKILEDFIAPYDAHVIERLKDQDAIIIGKTNLDEFAMGSSTENSGFFTTRNPWDTNRVPGGSSGGSTAAVASGMCSCALGSETGGSIRQPSAFCGTVGLKTTYGSVSRYGLVAFASSLDQIGPIAKDVSDVELIFNVIKGHDTRDSTSIAAEKFAAAQKPLTPNAAIGIPKEYFSIDGMDPDVAKAMESAISILKKQGFVFKDISLKHTKYSLPAYYIIAPAEASANLARYENIRYGLRKGPQPRQNDGLKEIYAINRQAGFGKEVQRRILIGTFALSHGYYDEYYGQAQKARALIADDFDRAFKDVELILAPSTPTPPFLIGEKTSDPISMYLSDIFTSPANIAGIPAMSIPCGSSSQGLPIGMQFMASHMQENKLFRISKIFEDATNREFIKSPINNKEVAQ